jgi:hypothetical protein
VIVVEEFKAFVLRPLRQQRRDDGRREDEQDREQEDG